MKKESVIKVIERTIEFLNQIKQLEIVHIRRKATFIIAELATILTLSGDSAFNFYDYQELESENIKLREDLIYLQKKLVIVEQQRKRLCQIIEETLKLVTDNSQQ